MSVRLNIPEGLLRFDFKPYLIWSHGEAGNVIPQTSTIRAYDRPSGRLIELVIFFHLSGTGFARI